MNYYNLHTHSEYSLMDGYSSLEKIVETVKEMGQTAVSLTEHGVMSSCYPMYELCKKNNIKFIPGVELYYVDDVTVKDRVMKHIIFYAKDFEGYKNLLQLVSESHKNYYYKPRCDIDIIKKYFKGLICTTACMGGILSKDKDKAQNDLIALKEIFKDDLYIELHTNNMDGQIEFNKWCIENANLYNIKMIPASDSHYSVINDSKIHKKWCTFGEEGYTVDDFYLHSFKDVLFYFNKNKKELLTNEDFNVIINNQQELVDKCNVVIDISGQNYPEYYTDDGKYIDSPYYFISELCYDKLETIDFDTISEEWNIYKKRVEYEIDILNKAGYLDYLLIIWDLCKYADKKKIPRGVGRGSVGGSLVAYLLGITMIDPIKYDLVFERFCHLERITPPDIDLDFSRERRGEIVDYLKDKYGHNNVFNVRTFGRMKESGALQRAGQVLKISPRFINYISKNILQEGKLEDIIESYKELSDSKTYVTSRQYDKDNLTINHWNELLELAIGFRGTIQNYGSHASAIVIFPKEYYNWCSIEKQGSGQNIDFVASYDFHDLEKMGILKLDILGLATTDLIYKVADNVNVDLMNIPIDDNKTFDMLCSGDTFGVFQIESVGMTDVIKQLQPRTYDEISAIVALYRPGPKDSGMLDEYIKRARGEKDIIYLHSKLEPILNTTYGIIVYQEQIQQITQALCGYTLAEGDMLRRIIGRKEIELMDGAINKLIESGVNNNINKDIMIEISDQIKTFALYGFNKAHAYEYGMMSYISAYLKANYMQDFVLELLNNDITNTVKTSEYVNKSEINILPPHYLYSKNKHSKEGNSIRFGYGAIKGVGSATIDTELEPIENMQFREWIIYQYMKGTNKKIFNNKRVIEAFIKAGMFGDNINFLVAEYEHACSCFKLYNNANNKLASYREKELSYKNNNEDIPKRINTSIKNWIKKAELYEDMISAILIYIKDSQLTYIRNQESVLGFSFYDKLDCFDLSPLGRFGNRNAIEVKAIKDWTMKNGRPMQFIKAYTKEGEKDFVIFEKSKMEVGEIYIIKLQKENIIDSYMEGIELG